MRKTLWLEKSEVRLHEDGTVDEIVIRDADGRCLFHLEQMSDVNYWMALYPYSRKLNAAVHIHINSKNGRSHIEGTVNDAGDATEKNE